MRYLLDRFGMVFPERIYDTVVDEEQLACTQQVTYCLCIAGLSRVMVLYYFENHFLQYMLWSFFAHSSDTTKGDSFNNHARPRSRLAVTLLLIPFSAMITSVVSVLISGLQTDMSPIADLLVISILAAVAMPQLRTCMSVWWPRGLQFCNVLRLIVLHFVHRRCVFVSLLISFCHCLHGSVSDSHDAFTYCTVTL